MGAELSFQIADIDSSHTVIIADVTMLVICYFRSGMRSQREHPSIGCQNFCEPGADSEGYCGAIPDVTAFACRALVPGIYAHIICLKMVRSDSTGGVPTFADCGLAVILLL